MSRQFRLFTQPFVQAQIKENIKARRYWPLSGEFTGDRWIQGSVTQKDLHLLTSSCRNSRQVNMIQVTHWRLFPTLNHKLFVPNSSFGKCQGGISFSLWLHFKDYYRQTSNVSCTKSQNLNVFRLILQLYFLNSLKSGFKSRMKV